MLVYDFNYFFTKTNTVELNYYKLVRYLHQLNVMEDVVKRKKEHKEQISLESMLMASAENLRGAMDPADYKHIVLGLVFLRYLSEAFEKKQTELQATELADPEDPEEYQAENVFWVPLAARWTPLAAMARSPDIGKKLDEAMRAIERENDQLKGVLHKDYGNPNLSPKMLGDLVDLFTNIQLKENGQDFDFLGRIYEFFLAEFAGKEGKRGGDFYTPPSIVQTLVEMIEPLHGRVYDPCCGTGGFFVQSEKLIKMHQGKIGDIAIYGQERNNTTWKLAKMNLAIRGVDADVRWNTEGTLLKDALPDLRFDYVLANPPFNVKEWSGELLKEDPRWKYGTPPEKNANFAWLQHIVHHLTPNGVAGVVLANGSMSSDTGTEGAIRRALVENNLIDCMVALPGQIFFGTQIPACLWILAKNRSNGRSGGVVLRDRRGEILFIDARQLGHMVSRTQRSLSNEDVHRVAEAYHSWRGQNGTGSYQDIAGFCRSATLDEVTQHNYVLTPGRYVGTEIGEDDAEPFDSKMKSLVDKLYEQMDLARELSSQIQQNLQGLGYA